MEPVIDTKAVAELLAVSPRTVERWVADDHIPYIRLGRLVRFRVSRLEAWLEERHHSPLN